MTFADLHSAKWLFAVLSMYMTITRFLIAVFIEHVQSASHRSHRIRHCNITLRPSKPGVSDSLNPKRILTFVKS